ncbi:2Fe-2S iron-sulfur cluster-binding protein [Haloferacaceae archaeon DSL9]
MPTISFRGREIECSEGENLRSALLRAGMTPHNGRSRRLNCRGNASCGTCAVRVAGEVSDPTRRERARLLAPPHHPNYRLRLSCQTRVLGDVDVAKFPGFWGTQVGDDPLPPVADDSGEGARDADERTRDADERTPSSASRP